jgi:ferrochelatase
VFDISGVGRFFLRNFIILPFRSPRVSKLYSEIWMKEGSPLFHYGKLVCQKLQERMGSGYVVALGMNYGNPSIEKALYELKACQLNKLIVLPLFPQYASSTTGSINEAVMKIITKWKVIPSLQFINSFYDHPAFINAWLEKAKVYDFNKYDHILFSYHGVPERHIQKADNDGKCLGSGCCDQISERNNYCYKANCHATSRLLVQKLHLPQEKYATCFQSLLGSTPWIGPYTQEVIKKLALEGKKNILVFSPAFVADCLETIHEIAIEYNEVFGKNGGEKLTLVESLNDHPAWISALEDIITPHTIKKTAFL